MNQLRLDQFPTRKCTDLIEILLKMGGRSDSASLSSTLWPAGTLDSRSQNLRKAVSMIRKTWGPESIEMRKGQVLLSRALVAQLLRVPSAAIPPQPTIDSVTAIGMLREIVQGRRTEFRPDVLQTILGGLPADFRNNPCGQAQHLFLRGKIERYSSSLVTSGRTLQVARVRALECSDRPLVSRIYEELIPISILLSLEDETFRLLSEVPWLSTHAYLKELAKIHFYGTRESVERVTSARLTESWGDEARSDSVASVMLAVDGRLEDAARKLQKVQKTDTSLHPHVQSCELFCQALIALQTGEIESALKFSTAFVELQSMFGASDHKIYAYETLYTAQQRAGLIEAASQTKQQVSELRRANEWSVTAWDRQRLSFAETA